MTSSLGKEALPQENLSSGFEATVRSEENAKQENKGGLAGVSRELCAIHPGVRICFCPGWLFKSYFV